MISIQTYLYDQTVDVQILDTGIFATRNRVVYVRPIKIYQGIDNPVVVSIKNQDQKAKNLTGFAVEAAIQDLATKTTIDAYAIDWTDITKGHGHFTITKDRVNLLDQRFYKITFKVVNTDTNVERPMYTDDNYGVPLDLEVLPAYNELEDIEYTIDAGTIV
jgi:hypothetical protein